MRKMDEDPSSFFVFKRKKIAFLKIHAGYIKEVKLRRETTSRWASKNNNRVIISPQKNL
jgi:hypothetical protein